MESFVQKYRGIFILLSFCYAQFFIAAAISLQAPFFPQEAESKGVTPSQYGFVFGIFELSVVLSSPIYAKLLSFVSAKFLVFTGIFMAGASVVLFGVTDQIEGSTSFLVFCFVIRVVEGFGSGSFLTASFSIVAREFPTKVATTFSTMQTFFGLGLIAGPLLGGALFQAGGYSLPFYLVGGFMILGGVIAAALVEEPKWEALPKSGNMWKFVSNFNIIMASLAIISSLTIIGFNVATFEPHVRQFQLSPVVLGVMFIIGGIVYSLTSPLWGVLCDKGVPAQLIIILGYIFCSVSLLILGPLPFMPFGASLWLIVVALVICSLGTSSKIVSAFYAAMKETRERGFPDDITTYAMVSALFSSSCSSGVFIGTSAGGIMVEHLGYEWATGVLLLMELILLILSAINLLWNKFRRVEKVPYSSIEESLPLKNGKS